MWKNSGAFKDESLLHEHSPSRFSIPKFHFSKFLSDKLISVLKEKSENQIKKRKFFIALEESHDRNISYCIVKMRHIRKTFISASFKADTHTSICDLIQVPCHLTLITHICTFFPCCYCYWNVQDVMKF